MKNNLSDMMCLDMYLSGLSKKEQKKLSKYIKPKKSLIPPLLCWDFYYPAFRNLLNKGTIETDLKSLDKFSKKHHWDIDLNNVLSTYQYEALVLTNDSKTILWVNAGFTKMTGYSKTFALSQTPAFLQGEKTSEEVKKRIRNKIQLKESFKEELVNYRKDGSEYLCEVRIFPLVGKDSMHFLALEREIA